MVLEYTDPVNVPSKVTGWFGIHQPKYIRNFRAPGPFIPGYEAKKVLRSEKYFVNKVNKVPGIVEFIKSSLFNKIESEVAIISMFQRKMQMLQATLTQLQLEDQRKVTEQTTKAPNHSKKKRKRRHLLQKKERRKSKKINRNPHPMKRHLKKKKNGYQKILP